jgi:outer membrane protein OmpA-like peptidoglycan-associated protein
MRFVPFSLKFLCATLFALTLLFSPVSPISAQVQPFVTTPVPVSTGPHIFVGPGVSAGLNFHTLNQSVYDCSPMFGVFTKATGLRPNFFFTLESPLSGMPDQSGWWISPRIHANFLGATITTPAVDNGNLLSSDSSSLIGVTREHRLAASLIDVGADLFMSYQFAGVNTSLKIFGGPSIGYMATRTADQTEVITAPSGAVFSDTHTDTRTPGNRLTPKLNAINAGVTLGAGVVVPLSKSTRLTPELSFTYPITQISSDVGWRVMSLRLGTALEFDVTPRPREPAVFVSNPPKQHSLSATVHLVGVVKPDANSADQEQNIPSVRIEEFVRREAYPLLNYVFFNEGSADIPERYYSFADKAGAESFQLNSLVDQPTLKVYYHTLNIIGRRLTDHPQATVTLIGSNDNTGIEANALHLSQARADAVKKYLTDVWGVAPSRVSTQATNLPRNPSPSDIKEGLEENRRVEIITNDPEILDPIATEAIDRTMNPPVLRVKTEIKSTSPETTNLTLMQGGQTLQDFGSARTSQDWMPLRAQIPLAEQPIVAVLHVKNQDGDETTVRDSTLVKQITVQKKRQEKSNDKLIERYSLITFDFDKADLDTRSQRVINDIASHVTPRDTIQVTGYTDLTGEANHNKTLSSDRAKNVQTALRNATIAKSSTALIAYNGEGEKNLVDNNLPEGRFLSRTVNIRIERPIGSE